MWAMDVDCVGGMHGAWLGGHGLGLYMGHLVMRHRPPVKSRNVEKKTCLNSEMRTLYMR